MKRGALILFDGDQDFLEMIRETIREELRQALNVTSQKSIWPLLSIDEVIEILKVSRPTVKGLIDSRQLRAIRIGREYRIRPEDVENYLKNRDID